MSFLPKLSSSSNPEGVGGNDDGSRRRARSSAAVIIAALAIFAAVVVVASNSLNWPLASEVQNFVTPPPRLQGFSNSSLLVSAASFVPASCGPGNTDCSFLNSTVRVPISSASVTVYAFDRQNQLHAVARNSTNANGTQLFLLRPGPYQVTMDTTQLGNISTIVTTSPNNTTELDVDINESTYACNFFESSSSLSSSSSNLVTPWDTIYMTVRAPSPIAQDGNRSVYVEFLSGSGSSSASSSSSSSTQPATQKYALRILDQYASPQDGTLSVQAQLANAVVDTSGTSQIYLLTYLLSFSTREYAMLTNMTETLPFPGAFS